MLYELHACHDDNDISCGWALWQMVEPEEELRSFCSPDCPPCGYTNSARRQEYYAVRAMLAAVLGADKIIAYHPSGSPYLIDHSYHISISHTKGFCALAWHAAHPVGVDVEQISDRVARVAHRFVSLTERSGVEAFFPSDVTLGQLFLWSSKEAAYKLAGRPTTDFLKDIIVDFSTLDSDSRTCSVLCRKDVSDGTSVQVAYPLHYRFYSSFVFVLVGFDGKEG